MLSRFPDKIDNTIEFSRLVDSTAEKNNKIPTYIFLLEEPWQNYNTLLWQQKMCVITLKLLFWVLNVYRIYYFVFGLSWAVRIENHSWGGSVDPKTLI